ncbi:MAG: hypothetical protein ACOYB0_08205 [Polynucleobacter sp.]
MKNSSGCGCADSVITIFQGDAYLAIDDRALCIDSAGCAWPPAMVAVSLILDPVSGGCGCPFNSAIAIDGTIIDSGAAAGPIKACFDLTSERTNQLALGHHAYRYRVVAQTINGNRVTLDAGRVSVR